MHIWLVLNPASRELGINKMQFRSPASDRSSRATARILALALPILSHFSRHKSESILDQFGFGERECFVPTLRL
jgi:hypothetical protein